jgi:redox-sensitive bicupin YhaK (pirin superfamily)
MRLINPLEYMSNVELVIEERATEIGSFLVGRLLPFRQKRSIGPFVFIDHMGPANITADKPLHVEPHPHIGLATLTYLFEGSMLHRDSLGTVQQILPGEVNWMVAGKGIVHSERSMVGEGKSPFTFHGMQIWIALPKNEETCEPEFHHVAAAKIPVIEDKTHHIKLVAGSIQNQSSPVPVKSKLFLLDIETENGGTLNIGAKLFGECGLFVLKGEVEIEGNSYSSGKLLYTTNPQLCPLKTFPGSRILIFGGEALPEPRHLLWNFVATDKEMLEKARQDWISDKFPKIPGETGRVPFPGT